MASSGQSETNLFQGGPELGGNRIRRVKQICLKAFLGKGSNRPQGAIVKKSMLPFRLDTRVSPISCDKQSQVAMVLSIEISGVCR